MQILTLAILTNRPARLWFNKLELELPVSILDAMTAAKVCDSKGEAKRLVRQGGVYLNGVKVADEAFNITSENLLCGKYIFIRVGRKNFHMAEF